jgi:hypothetical protein
MSHFAGFLIALAGFATHLSAEHLSMTIRVLDQANLPANKVKKMERYVETTLASIEVDVKWVDCASNLAACKAPRSTNEFWLRILAQMPPKASLGTDILGFTQHGDVDGIQCVNIFFPMVEQFSGQVGVDQPQIFGAAVVHEIGHLYLGTNSQAHSRTGIMCGTWSHREIELLSIGELTFTRDQGSRIRAAMNGAVGL